MLKDAADADVEAAVPSEEFLEEWRDQRWDTLPTVAAKVENLNRRLRRMEGKPSVEAKAKKVAKYIAAAAVVAGAAMGPVERFVSMYRMHDTPTAEQARGTSYPSIATDRVPRPDGGAK